MGEEEEEDSSEVGDPFASLLRPRRPGWIIGRFFRDVGMWVILKT